MALLQDVTVRSGEWELVSLALYDGIRVVERELLANAPTSLILCGTISREPETLAPLAFLNDRDGADGAVDAIMMAIHNGLCVVDLRAVSRQPSPEEVQALNHLQGNGPQNVPPSGTGAVRVTPEIAAEIIRQHEAAITKQQARTMTPAQRAQQIHGQAKPGLPPVAAPRKAVGP